jgi:hypothetical protein
MTGLPDWHYQIDETMRDDRRVIEKSRMPTQDSKRRRLSISADEESNDEDEEDAEEGRGYDREVYDDRPFYSLLLKVALPFSLLIDLSSLLGLHF